MNERFNFIHNPPWRLSPVPPPKKPVNMPFPKYYSHRPSPQILYLTWTMCYKQIIHDDVVFSIPPLQNIKVIFLCHPPSPFPFPVRSRMNPRPNYEHFRPDLGLLLHTASFSKAHRLFCSKWGRLLTGKSGQNNWFTWQYNVYYVLGRPLQIGSPRTQLKAINK